MRKQILIALTVIVMALAGVRLGVHAMAAAPTTAPTTEPSATPSTQPVNKKCAVETDDDIDPKVTTEYKGKTIGFCCESCVKKFKADPEKYMKDLK